MIKDHFIFHKHKGTKPNINYYRCSNKKCPGRATISESGDFALTSNHNHESDKTAVEKLKFRNTLHERALNTYESPHHILTSAISKIEDTSMYIHLPKLKSMNDSITKVRNKVNGGTMINVDEFPD